MYRQNKTMENTIYPGRRTTLLGGDATLDFLLRGYTNLDTLQALGSPLSNQSEIASFYYMLIPLLTIFLIRLYQKKLTAVELSLAVAILFILYFMFFGIPISIAEYSLWGRVPGKRADLALGFSCLVLTALLTNRDREKLTRPIKYLNLIAAASAISWTIIVYETTQNLDDSILSVFKQSSQYFVFSVTLISGFLLARGSIKTYFAVTLILSALTTYFFNPVVTAPNYVTVDIPALEKQEDIRKNNRILALDSSVPAMYLLASGAELVNGIFYYPQKTIWTRLDPDSNSSKIYNRYQHLRFYVSKTIENHKTFKLENPGPDRVEVALDAAQFDFSAVSAGIVVAPAAEEGLKNNASLTYIATQEGWMWLKVNK